jgi:hypothetical protein
MGVIGRILDLPREIKANYHAKNYDQLRDNLSEVNVIFQSYGAFIPVFSHLALVSLLYATTIRDKNEYKTVMKDEISNQISTVLIAVWIKNFVSDVILNRANHHTKEIQRKDPHFAHAIFNPKGKYYKEWRGLILYIAALIIHGLTKPIMNILEYKEIKTGSLLTKLKQLFGVEPLKNKPGSNLEFLFAHQIPGGLTAAKAGDDL